MAVRQLRSSSSCVERTPVNCAAVPKTRAAALEEESLAMARELGMRPLMERLLAGRGST